MRGHSKGALDYTLLERACMAVFSEFRHLPVPGPQAKSLLTVSALDLAQMEHFPSPPRLQHLQGHICQSLRVSSKRSVALSYPCLIVYVQIHAMSE